MAGGAFVAGEAYFDAFAGQRVDVHLGPFDEYQMPTAEDQTGVDEIVEMVRNGLDRDITLSRDFRRWCWAAFEHTQYGPEQFRSQVHRGWFPERSLSKSTVNRWRGAWSMEGRWGRAGHDFYDGEPVEPNCSLCSARSEQTYQTV